MLTSAPRKPITSLWLAGNEGVKKKMKTTKMDFIGTTIRIPPSFLANHRPAKSESVDQWLRRLVLEEKCTWDSQYVYDNMHPGTKQHQSSRSMTAVLESRRVQLDTVGCACRVTSELVVTRTCREF